MSGRIYKGELYLIPNLLGDEASPELLSNQCLNFINQAEYFFCENEKNCRRFLKKAGIKHPLDSIILKDLNKDTELKVLLQYVKELSEGKKAAMISDAGAPAVADPGADFIKLCHEFSIRIIPVPGPSSILLALMASGLNGQQFTFNGYLPVKENERKRALLDLSKRAINHTQIFMETPYRNLSMFESMMQALSPDILLCIAAGLNTPQEYVFTATISRWKTIKPPIHKVPAIFLLLKS